MRRHVQHRRIVLEDVLRPVAVMHVVVDDGDACRAERARVRRGNRDVVEETESHRAVALGVVAGRPHERECPRMRVADHVFHGIDGGASSQQRDAHESATVNVSGSKDTARPAVGEQSAADSRLVVNARELLVARGARRDDLSAALRASARPLRP